jgi:hypothetical protein
MAVLRFEPNTPEQVTLKFPSGKHVDGRFGEQVMFSLMDGRIMYVPIIVEKQIQELQVKRGQTIEISKQQANGKTEWKVRRVEAAKPAPKPMAHANGHASPVAALLDRAESLDAPDVDPPSSQLEHALRIALAAAKSAEKYSQEIGHAVQFDKDDIRLMAQTLVINNSKGRAA